MGKLEAEAEEREKLLAEYKKAEPELHHLVIEVGVNPVIIALVFASLGFRSGDTTNQGRPAGV